MLFRWNTWNFEHATRHGIETDEAESIVLRMSPPYPHQIGDKKWIAIGTGRGDRWVQVIFIYDPDGITVYIIHARPLTDREKKRVRRRRKYL